MGDDPQDQRDIREPEGAIGRHEGCREEIPARQREEPGNELRQPSVEGRQGDHQHGSLGVEDAAGVQSQRERGERKPSDADRHGVRDEGVALWNGC